MATVNVLWAVPNDGGGTITGHVVQRRTGTGAWATIATTTAAATSYSDTTAEVGTQYGYRHAATSDVGTAPFSDEVTILTAAPSSDYESVVLLASPRAYWRFEETTGTSVTDEVAARVGTTSGGVVLATDLGVAALGSGASFDGRDDVITVPYDAALNPTGAFGVKAWVHRQSASNNLLRILDNSGGGGYALWAGDYTLEFQAQNADGSRGAQLIWNGQMVDTLRVVEVTFDGTTFRMYVDGEEKVSAAGTYAARTSGAFLIGNRGDLARGWPGKIDEVAVFHYAPTLADIQARAAFKPARTYDWTGIEPLRVSGASLVTDSNVAAGKVTHLAGGCAYGMPIYLETAGGTLSQNYNARYAITRVYPKRKTWLANTKAEGANMVRLSVGGSVYNGFPMFGMTKADYVQRIVDYVEDAKAQGLRTIIGDWSAFTVFNSDVPGRYTEVFPLASAIIDALGKDNPWVIYEPHNEPGANNQTLDQWLTVMKGTLDHYRTTKGVMGVLMIDTTNWSHDFYTYYVDELLAYDATLRAGAAVAPGKHQIVIANHHYAKDWTPGSNDRTAWEGKILQRVKEGYAIHVTESGYYDSAQPAVASAPMDFVNAIANTYVNDGLLGFSPFVIGVWGDGSDQNRMHFDDGAASRTDWGIRAVSAAAAAAANTAAPPAPVAKQTSWAHKKGWTGTSSGVTSTDNGTYRTLTYTSATSGNLQGSSHMFDVPTGNELPITISVSVRTSVGGFSGGSARVSFFNNKKQYLDNRSTSGSGLSSLSTTFETRTFSVKVPLGAARAEIKFDLSGAATNDAVDVEEAITVSIA